MARRAHIEAIVEQLLELLDVIDGDADLEPSLGSIERHPSPHVTWSGRDRTGDQTHWSDGPTVDLEHDAGEDVEEAGAVMRGGSEHHA